MMAKHLNYTLDSECKFIPRKNCPVKNFDELKKLLLSTDLTLDADWNKDDELCFLDKKVDMTCNKVAF